MAWKNGNLCFTQFVAVKNSNIVKKPFCRKLCVMLSPAVLVPQKGKNQSEHVLTCKEFRRKPGKYERANSNAYANTTWLVKHAKEKALRITSNKVCIRSKLYK